ncbi:MAG: hypothetical protein CL724_06995 [Chloroflexi bacterium]|nr:hypothetical protein [Chloroflexota bacterium]
MPLIVLFRPLVTAATLCLTLAPCSAVPPLEPTWTGRDTQLIIDRLDLTGSDSAEIIAALLKDYETQWVAAREDLRTRTSKGTPVGATIEAVHGFQQHQTQLADVLTQNIDIILGDQRTSWQQLQNEMWRLRRLKHGRLTGERCDLSSLLEQFPLLAGEADPEVILRWEAGIAPLLANREPFDIEGPSRFQYLVMDGHNEEAWEYLSEWVEIRVAIRDLTLQTIEDIAASMPPDRQVAFRAAIASHVLPFNPRRRKIDQLVSGVRQGDTIADDTLAAIEGIYLEYLHAVADLEQSRQLLERSLQLATMLSQMQRRTGRPTKVPQLQQAQLENELALQEHAAGYLKQMCKLVDSPLCHPTPIRKPKQQSAPPQPILHPSGLPLGETPDGGTSQPNGQSPLPAEPPNPEPESPFPGG